MALTQAQIRAKSKEALKLSDFIPGLNENIGPLPDYATKGASTLSQQRYGSMDAADRREPGLNFHSTNASSLLTDADFKRIYGVTRDDYTKGEDAYRAEVARKDAEAQAHNDRGVNIARALTLAAIGGGATYGAMGAGGAGASLGTGLGEGATSIGALTPEAAYAGGLPLSNSMIAGMGGAEGIGAAGGALGVAGAADGLGGDTLAKFMEDNPLQHEATPDVPVGNGTPSYPAPTTPPTDPGLPWSVRSLTNGAGLGSLANKVVDKAGNAVINKGVGAALGGLIGGSTGGKVTPGSNTGNTSGGILGGNSSSSGNTDWGGLLSGLYDAYANKQAANALKPSLDRLNGMYQIGTPEANQMQKELDARDAAAGRRSQYGTRAVELRAKLADSTAKLLSSPGYLELNKAYQQSNTAPAAGLLSLLSGKGGGSNLINAGGNALTSWLSNLFKGNTTGTGTSNPDVTVPNNGPSTPPNDPGLPDTDANGLPNGWDTAPTTPTPQVDTSSNVDGTDTNYLNNMFNFSMGGAGNSAFNRSAPSPTGGNTLANTAGVMTGNIPNVSMGGAGPTNTTRTAFSQQQMSGNPFHPVAETGAPNTTTNISPATLVTAPYSGQSPQAGSYGAAIASGKPLTSLQQQWQAERAPDTAQYSDPNGIRNSFNYMAATNHPSIVPSQLKSDYDKWFDNTAIGGSSPFAGGTLTKMDLPNIESGGAAVFTDANGNKTNVLKNSGLLDLANSNSSIADAWKKQYGFDAKAIQDQQNNGLSSMYAGGS